MTSFNEKVSFSFTKKERFIDSFIIVGWDGLLVLLSVFAFLYSLNYEKVSLVIISFIMFLVFLSFSIFFQWVYGPRFRLDLACKYRDLYREHSYILQGSLQQYHSQTYRIQFHMSRPVKLTTDIKILVDKNLNITKNNDELVILLINKNQIGQQKDFSNVDYVAYYDFNGDKLKIVKFEEVINISKKQKLFGKYYDKITIELYIERIFIEKNRFK